MPSRRQETTTVALLLALAAFAWALTFYQAKTMTCGMCRGMSIACPMCMGQGLPLWVSFPSFLTMWTTMMAAMMLPSILPMVLLFARVESQRRNPETKTAPTWIFVSGYLFSWTLLGFIAFAGIYSFQWILMKFPLLLRFHNLAGGLTLFVGGLYNLSPFKNSCLRRCQSPLDFLLFHWKEGKRGALWMGFSHGLYCIGCCSGLMLILFAVGLMNLAWMAALTVVMGLEKTSTRGLFIGRMAGISLLLLGGTKLFANL